MDLEVYTTFVLGISSNTETIKVFPNQKPWLDSSMRVLLRGFVAAFRSGDMQEYSVAQRNQKYKLRIEEHFNNTNKPCSMWKGYQDTAAPQNQHFPTDWWGLCSPRHSKSVLCPLWPARQHCGTYHSGERWLSEGKPGEGTAMTQQHHQVRFTLLRINSNKTTGLDGAPSRSLL